MTKIVWEEWLEMQVRTSLDIHELFFAAAQRNFCVLVSSMCSKPSNIVTGDSFSITVQLCQWDARVALWVKAWLSGRKCTFYSCHLPQDKSWGISLIFPIVIWWKREKKCYSLQSSIVNSSGVSKVSMCLRQGFQGLPGLHCLLCLRSRVLESWPGCCCWCQDGIVVPDQLFYWQKGRSLLGNTRHNCPNSFCHCRSTSPDALLSLVHLLLLYHYFPCKSILVSLMLLSFHLGPAIFNFKFGAEKPGQSLLHVWPLETLDLLGCFRDCCLLEKQMLYKIIQCRYELWTIPLVLSIPGKV